MRLHYVVIGLLLVSLAALAQSDRGTITGTISDPANAIIPGAKVSAKNVETGAAYETVTTGTGNYTLPSLPVGSYDLTVEASGFGRYLQQGITIQRVYSPNPGSFTMRVNGGVNNSYKVLMD